MGTCQHSGCAVPGTHRTLTYYRHERFDQCICRILCEEHHKEWQTSNADGDLVFFPIDQPETAPAKI